MEEFELTSATAVVEAQVGAFNDHDLEAFLATYAADAVVVGVAAEPLRGAAALREFYTPRMQDANLSCTVDVQLQLGERWVVARELVTSSAGTSETIATFEVLNGAITRASMLKA